jgi:hypothetical protein
MLPPACTINLRLFTGGSVVVWIGTKCAHTRQKKKEKKERKKETLAQT